MAESLDNDELMICIDCGYDLRQTHSGRCNECGKPFDRESLKTSLLPWESSRSVMSFLRTAWRVAFARKQIRDEVCRPHDLCRAKLFRRIIGIAMAISLMGFLAISNQVFKTSPGELMIQNAKEIALHPQSLSDRYPFDLQLLLGIAYSGWSAYLILALFGWDWVRLPGAILKNKKLSEPRKQRDQSLSCYLCGPYAIAVLWLWVGMGLQLLVRLKIPDTFFTTNPGPLYSAFTGSLLLLSYLPFLIAFVFIPLRWLIQLLSWKRAVHQIRIWGIYGMLLKMFCLGIGRAFFWLVWTPLFIGLIRMIVESLLWR